jgi:hypothetical protein
MEATTIWIQRHCNMDSIEDFGRKIGTDRVANAMSIQHVDSAHVLLYGAVILTATLYLIGRQIRKNAPKATLSSRPRSPDPEKPTDVTTYAAKRMKPTERPPGSKFKPPWRIAVHSNQILSLGTKPLQTPNSSTTPRLVSHRLLTPSLPPLPSRPQIQHQPRPP